MELIMVGFVTLGSFMDGSLVAHYYYIALLPVFLYNIYRITETYNFRIPRLHDVVRELQQDQEILPIPTPHINSQKGKRVSFKPNPVDLGSGLAQNEQLSEHHR